MGLDKAVEEEGAIGGGVDLACTAPLGILIARETAALEGYCPEEKMFGFHKPKMY